MSDRQDGRASDRIRRSLRATADDLRLDPVDTAALLGRAATRRRRRRFALAGGSTVVAVSKRS